MTIVDNQPQPFAQFLHLLREALPYIDEFSQQTFVIYLSGNALLQSKLSRIWEDLLLLHRVGIQIVIVHGAFPQIKTAFAENSIAVSESVEFPLFASEKMIHVAVQTISSMSWEILAKLRTLGAIPYASPYLRASWKETSFPYSLGSFEQLDEEAMSQVLSHKHIPIVAPLGITSSGKIAVLHPREVAQEVAVRLGAKKLITLDDQLSENSLNLNDLQGIHPQRLTQWIKEHSSLSVVTQMHLQSLILACQRGVERCHLLDSKTEGVLLAEILTSGGLGIMITNQSYQVVRPAVSSDINAILEILDQPMQHAQIVHRPHGYLQKYFKQFVVLCIDEDVVGCCELIPYTMNKQVEISTFAIRVQYRNRGLGKAVIQEVLQRLIKQKYQYVFALTTHSNNVFLQCGFEEITVEKLPAARRENYDTPQSRIFGKALLSNP